MLGRFVGLPKSIFGGVFTGVFGGLLYVVIRRWVPGSGLRKGLAFGVILFLLAGSGVIEKGNVDFALFGPPLPGVSLFALLFPLYGLVLSPIVERFDRYVPSLFAHPIATVVGYLVLGGACVSGFVLDVLAINAII